ncbi:MAG TPA: amidohydrolase family protein, partial [Sphingomonas sp.]|nr:amidohydrolase family protein [Sphingomonas sp.]
GKRGADREPPTEADLARMTRIVAEGIRAGALGVSTSRSMAHRTVAGELAPTVTSEEREYAALARGLAEAGSGVFQIIPSAQEGTDPEEEMAMLRRLVGISGRPLSFSLINTVQHADAMEKTLELLSLAQADGAPIRAQVFPRGIGVLFGLDLSFHPFRYHPSYRAIEHLPLAERVAAMRSPELRERLLGETIDHPNATFQYFAQQSGELYPLGDPPNYEPLPEDKIAALAARRGMNPQELVYDLLLEQDGQATLLLPAANYVGGSLEPVRAMLEHPHTLIALGDGGAHYGMICDSSYPTTLLSYWTRDRVRGPRLPLPSAVRSLSHANAVAIGLTDRGLVKPGMKADLNVIDYDRLRLRAPRVQWDLPAGGRRLVQSAEGFDATIVSGVITYRNGQATGARPGRLVRNPALH